MEKERESEKSLADKDNECDCTWRPRKEEY